MSATNRRRIGRKRNAQEYKAGTALEVASISATEIKTTTLQVGGMPVTGGSSDYAYFFQDNTLSTPTTLVVSTLAELNATSPFVKMAGSASWAVSGGGRFVYNGTSPITASITVSMAMTKTGGDKRGRIVLVKDAAILLDVFAHVQQDEYRIMTTIGIFTINPGEEIWTEISNEENNEDFIVRSYQLTVVPL